MRIHQFTYLMTLTGIMSLISFLMTSCSYMDNIEENVESFKTGIKSRTIPMDSTIITEKTATDSITKEPLTTNAKNSDGEIYRVSINMNMYGKYYHCSIKDSPITINYKTTDPRYFIPINEEEGKCDIDYDKSGFGASECKIALTVLHNEENFRTIGLKITDTRTYAGIYSTVTTHYYKITCDRSLTAQISHTIATKKKTENDLEEENDTKEEKINYQTAIAI